MISATVEMLKAWETDKQRVDVFLRANVRHMKKSVDDMEIPSVGCVVHT